jgi:hypothetical protein
MPKSSRPPEMTSTVAAIFASSVGDRSRLLVTMTPSRRPLAGGEAARPAVATYRGTSRVGTVTRVCG